jgi:hypothetical protein
VLRISPLTIERRSRRRQEDDRDVAHMLERADVLGRSDRVDDDRVNVRECIFRLDFVHGLDAERAEADFLETGLDRRLVVQGIEEKYRAIVERIQLLANRRPRRLGDIRSEGEIEGGSEAGLRVDPHIALHEVHEAFGD